MEARTYSQTKKKQGPRHHRAAITGLQATQAKQARRVHGCLNVHVKCMAGARVYASGEPVKAGSLCKPKASTQYCSWRKHAQGKQAQHAARQRKHCKQRHSSKQARQASKASNTKQAGQAKQARQSARQAKPSKQSKSSPSKGINAGSGSYEGKASAGQKASTCAPQAHAQRACLHVSI